MSAAAILSSAKIYVREYNYLATHYCPCSCAEVAAAAAAAAAAAGVSLQHIICI